MTGINIDSTGFLVIDNVGGVTAGDCVGKMV